MSQSIEELSADDEEHLIRQVYAVNELLLSLGELPLQQTFDDCAKIQAILDAAVLQKSDTWLLQSLGIALGNVMAAMLQLHWTMVTDEYGRDPALQFKGSTNLVFPLTMISKRVERGDRVKVEWLISETSEFVRQWGQSYK